MKNRSARKVNAQLQIIKDNLSKPKRISQFVLPIILGLFILNLISYAAINIGYYNRLISSENEVSSEVDQSIIILNENEVRSDNEEVNKIFFKNESLFTSRKIKTVTIYILGSGVDEDNLRNEISSTLSKINNDSIVYNFTYNNIEDVCRNVQNFDTGKGLLFTTGENILRSLYLCNFFNLYYTGFKVEETEGIRGVKPISFDLFIKDFLKNIFNLDQV